MSNAITVAPMAFEVGSPKSDRALTENRNRVAAGKLGSLQGVIGGACSTGNRSSRFKVELVGEVNKSGRRDLHVGRVSAMAIDAIDRDAFLAKLSPARATMRAAAAAGIVVDHDALADAGQSSWHGGADGDDHSAGLVSRTIASPAPAIPSLCTPAPDGARQNFRSDPHIPEALISRTTSDGPGVGSRTSMKAILRSPAKLTPRMIVLQRVGD